MHQLPKYLCCLFLCFVYHINCRAQSAYFTTHLDNTSGLSNNSVKHIFQDSDQLLWVSTADGLNVYNGRTFQLFKSQDQGGIFKLPDNKILNVLEDKKKQIWICSEKGVTCYNKGNGSLQHYFYSHNNGSNRPTGSADYFLSINKPGTIIAGLRLDTILYIYNDRLKTFQPINFDQGSIGMIAEIGFDDMDRLWTLSIGGALRVFSQQGKYFRQIKSFESFGGIHLFYKANHEIFYASGNRVLHHITPDLNDQVVLTMPRLANAVGYYQGHYLISYTYKGVQEFDQNFKQSSDIIKESSNLKDIEVTSFLAGNDNVLWLSTTDRGIFKIVKNQNNFGTVNTDPTSKPITSAVSAIAQIGNEIWIGTKSSGILRYSKLNENIRSGNVENPVHAFFDLQFNNYYSIKKGTDGNVYVGSDAFGVTIYDPRLNKFTPWTEIEGTGFDPHFFRVFSILPMPDSSLYVGYLHGLIHLKISRSPSGSYKLDYLKEFKNARRFLNLGNNAISALAQQGDYLLMGYQYGGLVLMNLKTGVTISILNQVGKSSLSSNNITSLYIDNTDNLWIGTDFGLNKVSFNVLLKKDPLFQVLNGANGLPDNTVHSIIESDDHMIWVSTNRGLAKINPNTLRVVQYRVQDGLQNDEFTDGAVLKDKTGKLYFGGIAGFNHFDPTKIAVDNRLPNLLISDLNIGDRINTGIRLTIVKPTENYTAKVYDVQRNQNFFHLRIEPANGFTNAKFQLKFILKGFDNHWRNLNDNNQIEYSSLPAGQYDFCVKWSNGQGAWTADKSVFRVTVAPYFLWSPVAQVIYLLLLTAIIYAIYFYRKKRIDIKNKLYIENLIRVKEQKLYEDKVNFFTNITHELQTPLTLILGAIERFFYRQKQGYQNDDKLKFLRIANQEAFRLQYLVHQLLEFRKAESGHAKILLDTFNASNLITNIAELFKPIEDQKSLNFSLSVEPGIIVHSDKDKFEKIVFNLLSNAFKHSPISGSIKCLVKLGNDRSLALTIANSGFEPRDVNLSLLFEQFYTPDHNDKTKESSGIGLALTRQLTEILRGKISVEAEPDWIIFHLNLPLNAGRKQEVIPDSGKIVSDKPSYLVRSIVESMEITDDTINKNNDTALLENLENPGKKSILIVEDDPNIRLLLKEVLQENYVVYQAENGQAAIQLLKKIITDLILSDVLMSDMDGITLCGIVKNTVETCHIPFLLLSARGTAENKLEGFEAGADAYMTKPYSTTGLLKKIKELIDYRENIQQFLSKNQYIQLVNNVGLKEEDQTFLNKLIEVIRVNLADPELDASVLEQALTLSRMSFHRKLKSLTNMTPSEFIRQMRLRHAATRLQTTNLTVSEICFQCGFNNQSYFYREFKKMYHSSPKEFKEHCQIG